MSTTITRPPVQEQRPTSGPARLPAGTIPGHPNLRPWPKGVSGNPRGRPRETRDRLTGDFIRALAEDFAEHGAQAIAACRQTDPAAYLRLVAGLLPRELNVRRSPLDDLDHQQLLKLADALQAAVEAAKAGVPLPGLDLIAEGAADT
ncbi:MAG: hypothetical protein IRY87_00050 [Acetobacteraceae bacterium]|nr:hypothetical protein [Acetobacteraceae bacterium]